MKLIRDIETVDWFESKNYQQLGKLTHEDWLLELETRAHYYNTPFTGPRKGSNFDLFSPRDESAIEAERAYAENYRDIAIWVNDELVFTNPVTRSAHFARLEFSYDMGNIAIRPIQNGESVNHESTSIPYYIDISAPDELLHILLDLTLERDRKHLQSHFPAAVGSTNFKGKIRHIDDTDLRSWVTCGLLQYLDLYQWALVNNVRITNDAYAAAIHTTSNAVANPGKSITETTKRCGNNAQHNLIMLGKQVGGKWTMKSVDQIEQK